MFLDLRIAWTAEEEREGEGEGVLLEQGEVGGCVDAVHARARRGLQHVFEADLARSELPRACCLGISNIQSSRGRVEFSDEDEGCYGWGEKIK